MIPSVKMIDIAFQALAKAVQMRVAQKVYFKSRTRDHLIDSKMLERDFDLMIAEFRKAKEENDADAAAAVPRAGAEEPNG